MFEPVSTYRLQFHAGFNFSDFERIITYLHRLGVTTIYASPIFKAVHGSTHGYDGVDPHQLNPEIGTLEQLVRLNTQLKEKGMYWLQDIVPNHMAFVPDNPWLNDVLEKGQRSGYADFFDINWDLPGYKGRLMAPFLGRSLADTIKDGHLKIAFHNDKLILNCNEALYPLNLSSCLRLLDNPASPETIRFLINELTNIELTIDNNEYGEKLKDWQARFTLLQQNEKIKSWISHRLEQVNNDRLLLQQIADEQYYSLCYWRETDNVINYRRFFTVNALISLNMQDLNLFYYYHQFIKTLLDENLVQGLRIDHIDGLYNPAEYLRRLRQLTGRDTYITVEKILEPGERLPVHWPIQGTTGYEYLSIISNLFSQQKSEQQFSEFYNNLAENRAQVITLVHEKKTNILYQHMAGDLENLYNLFLQLHLATPALIQSIEPGLLKKAIGAFLIYCPVYRYYGERLPFDTTEASAIKTIIDQIKVAQPQLLKPIELLEYVWLKKANEGNDDYNSRAAHFYKRCMQYTGPLMAKGVEDTLMYSFNRLIAHNEVGDAPDAFGLHVKNFHARMEERQQRWPLSLNASSTHDTKRGEDVRARLNVLTDLPDEWFQHVKNWQHLNKTLVQDAPTTNDEYFIYQTLIGTYPMPGDDEENYKERLKEYLQKALRESKTNSSWTDPDEAYENTVENFALQLLDKTTPFWNSFKEIFNSIAEFGVVNSLAQVILKFTCPGVPDIYQGCELWDLSFVDPDNRRPIDYKKHQLLLESISTVEPSSKLLEALWEERFDGRIKLWLVNTLLKIRQQQPQIFTYGTYIPLSVEGVYQKNIVAFARQLGDTWLLIAIPLHIAVICKEQDKPINNLDWKKTKIIMPKKLSGEWHSLTAGIGDDEVSALDIQQLFKTVPFAVLKMKAVNIQRSAGVLMHITSLPSAFGIGDLGPESYLFADFLYRNGQKYWQLLPLSPVDGSQGYSPYSATSSYAGNTLLISPEILVSDGLLQPGELAGYHVVNKGVTDYSKAETSKEKLLTLAWNAFNNKKSIPLEQAFSAFCSTEKKWLHDYALFTVLKQQHQGKPWFEWEERFKHHQQETLETFAEEHTLIIRKIKWIQFIFFRQWRALKAYCNSKNIQLIGDLPFYVNYDSADVWSQREIFNLHKNGERNGVAGVPPDLFSDTGQLWGMPVYNWETLKSRDYGWWIDRLQKNIELFDLVRLDHFRAFSSYWEVPATEKTAINGEWKTGPGNHFFNIVSKKLGSLPFLAEDLGDIDEAVFELRDSFKLPGMKVLQFAFGDNFPFSDHLPHNYTHNFFAYTGTHDNNTLRGWFRNETTENTIRKLTQYAGQTVTDKNIHQIVSRLAYASVAGTVIVPLQDLLGLDETARMNTPALGTENWLWRLKQYELDEEAENRLKECMKIYDRG